jgi:ParB-like chromosome segregation protein Spo0J
MDDIIIRIDDIYVPSKRRRTVNPTAVEALAAAIMEDGQRLPILVRRGKEGFVLVDGLQRLEACKALGEETITAIIVQARRSM